MSNFLHIHAQTLELDTENLKTEKHKKKQQNKNHKIPIQDRAHDPGK